MSTEIVDIEKLVSNYLREQVPDTRFVGKTPDETTARSWVRVTMIDGPAAFPDHLVAFLVQLDCYASKAGGQPEANTLARQTRNALGPAFVGSYSEGVVTGCDITGHARLPDSDFEPARERVALTATIWAHS